MDVPSGEEVVENSCGWFSHEGSIIHTTESQHNHHLWLSPKCRWVVFVLSTQSLVETLTFRGEGGRGGDLKVMHSEGGGGNNKGQKGLDNQN